MHRVSEPASSSIMARIARVRERMLIEVVAGIPASNKALFLPLCQDYEQRSTEIPLQPDSLYRNIYRSNENLPAPSIQQGYRWRKGSNDWDNDPSWKDWEDWADWNKKDSSSRDDDLWQHDWKDEWDDWSDEK